MKKQVIVGLGDPVGRRVGDIEVWAKIDFSGWLVEKNNERHQTMVNQR
jgi:hypothetical protein